MGEAKYYNLMIVPDGVESPLGFRMRAWVFKLLVILLALIFVGMVLFFALYGKIVSRAMLADQLEKEIPPHRLGSFLGNFQIISNHSH